MALEKVYAVEFMHYTNCMKDTVSDGNEIKYLRVGTEPFLVRESELNKYRSYGFGYRNIKFVGNMEES